MFEGPCEAARLRLAIARDGTHRRASLRMRAQGVGPLARLRATLRPAFVRARTTPDVLRAKRLCARHVRHDGTRPRRALLTPATPRPLQAGGVAPCHSQSGVPPAFSGQGMRFQPPRSAREYARGARSV